MRAIGGVPWGISVRVLQRSPHLIAFCDRILVDEDALYAETRAGRSDKLNWISGKIFERLATKHDVFTSMPSVHTYDVEELIANTLSSLKLRDKVESDLKSALQTNELVKLYEGIDAVDISLSEGLHPNFNSADPMYADSAPSWWQEARGLLLNVYLSSDFFLLPALPRPDENGTPLERALYNSQKGEAPFARQLALGQISIDDYQDTVRDKCLPYYQEIDSYFDGAKGPEGTRYETMNWEGRLNELMSYRERFLKVASEVKRQVKPLVDQGKTGRLPPSALEEEVCKEVTQKAADLASFESSYPHNYRLEFGIATTLTAGAIGSTMAGSQALTGALGGSALTSWLVIIRTLFQKGAKERENALGYVTYRRD
jgi:hypothetical protein